jgi:signal transduction histidine kinase
MLPGIFTLLRAKRLLLLPVLASAGLLAFAPCTPDAAQSANEATSAVPPLQTDDATLNLHRWGAVTLFHGLPSDRVRAIHEDAHGAIWIGTDNGLVRYDGRNTQAFAQESALPARLVLALASEARGALWIGTENGAARWQNERLEVLPETAGRAVNGIAANQREIVAVTSQGELIRYQLTPDNQPSSQLATPAKLPASKLDASNHRLLSLADQNNVARPLNLTCVWATASGDFWLGSGGRGAMLHHSATGQANEQLREAALQPPRPYHINAVYTEGDKVWIGEALQGSRAPGLWLLENNALARLNLNTGAVTALHGGAGDLWVGTANQGAFLLRNGQVIERLTFDNTGGGLRSNRISAIYRDREGIVWFGTDRGVCRYDRDSFRAATLSNSGESNFVRELLVAQNGETWCGTNRGLFKLAPGADLGPWNEVAALQGRAVYALLDQAGDIWAGTHSGLFVKAKGASDFARLTLAEPETTDEAAEPDSQLSPQPHESVRALALFRGSLYAAFYERGLERIDEGKRVLVLNDAAVQQAVCLAAENEQALWLGTAAGQLLRYDGKQLSAIAWPGKQAVKALAIRNGRVWLGTAQGLFLREGEQVREVLAGVDVNDLLVLPEGEKREVIWCATKNAGLIKLLPDEGVSIRFDTEQGLASQQVFALAVNQNNLWQNNLWVGTARGVVRHLPSLAQPRLEMRRLVADATYAPETLTAELSLPSTQRNFLLEVAALGSRTFPSQFQYEFTIQRRNGSESRTLRSSDPQFAVNDLRAGPYTVTARAISRDLVYSEPLLIRLRVRNSPFPWTTVGLAALLAVAVAAAIWAFRQRDRLTVTNRALEETNAKLCETRLRLARETEAERARIARDLHDQTLADLRHLLVLTDQLPAGKSESGQTPTPALLRGKIEAVSSEIRHICEDLSPSVLENIGFLPALEWALSDAVAQMPVAEKFAYEFACAPELEERLQLSAIEQIQLYRIVQEALNNVCRHARARHVQMSVRAAGQRDLLIELRDDGSGFNADALTNVTGHGIANIRSRANLIGAQVEWQAAKPGCRFVVRQANCVRA